MGWLSLKGRGSFGANVGRPIVTNGDFVAQLCGRDALFPNYFREDSLFFLKGKLSFKRSEQLCWKLRQEFQRSHHSISATTLQDLWDVSPMTVKNLEIKCIYGFLQLL